MEALISNNKHIMDAIRRGTSKLGLVINEDETMQSCDMMIYGKVMVISGMFRGLHEKRLSRVTGSTNDQFPSLASIMGTVVTNCLTIANYSDSPINAMVQYNWIGNFVLFLLESYNPALRASMYSFIPNQEINPTGFLEYRIRALYLDPALGGVYGISLTRFLIRRFPDALTEGLSFWKGVYIESRSREIQDLCEGRQS